MIIFDSKTLGFYDSELKSAYEKAGSWPEDGIEIDSDTHLKYLSGKAGYKLGANKKGEPTWVKVQVSQEDKKADIEAEIKQRSSEVLDRINVLQYAEDLNMSTKEEKESLLNLKKYIVELHRVVNQEAYPDKINWPEIPKT